MEKCKSKIHRYIEFKKLILDIEFVVTLAFFIHPVRLVSVPHGTANKYPYNKDLPKIFEAVLFGPKLVR